MQKPLKKLHKTPRPLRIIHAGAYEAGKGVDFPPHRHSYAELVYYRSGSIECVMAGQSRPGQAGLAWLTPPGVTHAERALTAYTNYYLALELPEAAGRPAFLEDDTDRSLGHLCRQLVLEWNRKSPERERMLVLLAGQLECQLARMSRRPILSFPAQTVAEAERLIEEKSHRPLTIREVAEAVNVSVSSLRGYFHAVRQCSPREHLRQIRLEKALRFLRTSTLKLEAIAELCGYDSASHLTRCVKKSTGRTPGKIRHTSRADHVAKP
jgi:AraC-like DNA-binding protein